MAPGHGTRASSWLSLPRGCPEALPPLPAGSQLHGCFLCRRCRISLPTFPTSLLARAGATRGVGRGLLAEQGPPGSLLAIRGSAPSPEGVGGSRSCLSRVRPGRAHPCCGDRMGRGWHGEGSCGKRCGCAQGEMQRHSLIPGGCQGLSPPGGTRCPPLHIPGACNVQRKPKKPAVGGMEEGSAADPLSRLSSRGSEPVGGPSLPCSPPSACPASALLMGGL